MVSTLRKVHDRRLEFLHRIETQGADTEIAYMALRTGAEFLRSLKDEPLFELTAADEGAVWERILDEYIVFLTLLGETGAEAARVVDDQRRAGPLDGARVQAWLDDFESEVSLDEDEARHARTRDAMLRRVGGAR